jgi:hypothetical protein
MIANGEEQMNDSTGQQPTGRTPVFGVFRLLVILAMIIGVAARSISAAPITEPERGNQPNTVHGQAATPISAEEPTPTEPAFEPAEVTISIEIWKPRVNPVTTDSISAVAQFTGSTGAGQVRGTVQFSICGPDAAQPCTIAAAMPLGPPKPFTLSRVQSPSFTPADSNAAGIYCFLVEYVPETGSPYPPTTFTDSSACFTLSLPSLTIILEGKDDGAASGGHLVDFGVVSSRGTAPTVDGVTVTQSANSATYTANNALKVTVKAEGSAWVGTCYLSESGSTNLNLAWKFDSVAAIPFASDAAGGQGCIPSAPLGTTEGLYIYDLQLTVGWDDPPGTTSSTIVFGVAAP